MDNKIDWRTFAEAVVMILGAAWLGYSATSSFPITGIWKAVGIAAGLIFFLGSILLHFMDLQTTLNDIRPKIDVSGDPVPHDVGMGHPQRDGGFKTIAISNMAAIAFANKPKHRTDRNHANGVRAEITYLDKNRNILIGPIDGRWGQTDQPSEIKRSETPRIESVNFPNNGAKRTLDFLMKYPEDDYCYAFNNKSYNYGYLFQNPSYEIKNKNFIVQIRLLGSYIPDKSWELEVVTKGKNDTYKIRYGEKWQKTENSQATKQVISERQVKIKSLKPPKLST